MKRILLLWEKTGPVLGQNCVYSIVSLSLLPNFKEGELGGGQSYLLRQCLPLSGQTAVWFPVSSSGISASDENWGLRKGQTRLENENAEKHHNPPAIHSKKTFDQNITH